MSIIGCWQTASIAVLPVLDVKGTVICIVFMTSIAAYASS
jgi:hypothetical protein